VLGGLHDIFSFSGDFLNHSQCNIDWNTDFATLRFTGAGRHEFDLAGADLGAGPDGCRNNFAFGVLSFDAGTQLDLEDGNTTPGAALYVREFDLPGHDPGELGNIVSAFNIYYDRNDPANAYLGGLDYVLEGGGELIATTAPPLPEPPSLALLLSGLVLLGAGRLAKRATTTKQSITESGLAASLAVTVTALASAAALAADDTWDGNGNGSWSDGNHWSLGSPPGPGDAAFLRGLFNQTVTLTAPTNTAQSVTVGGQGGEVTLAAGDNNLNVSGAVRVGDTLSSGSFVLSGGTLSAGSESIGVGFPGAIGTFTHSGGLNSTGALTIGLGLGSIQSVGQRITDSIVGNYRRRF
jgi:hypothetical protein